MTQDEKLALIAEILRSMDPQAETKREPAPQALPKMRTLPDAVREVQKEDPDTALTLSALRRAVKRGDLPCVKVNTKSLVNMADLYAYLSGTLQSKNTEHGIIRKIGG